MVIEISNTIWVLRVSINLELEVFRVCRVANMCVWIKSYIFVIHGKSV